MSDKIMLLDGHSLLNRAFYGLPDLTNAEGKHTNAVLGFLNIMLRYVEEEKPTHLLVAFDRKEPTFRHIKYKEYKGTRKPMPAELHEQVPLMKEVLKTMEIPIITQAGIEADDILGTIGKEAEEAGFDVAIVSGDRDLLQLATKKVKVKIPWEILLIIFLESLESGRKRRQRLLRNIILLRMRMTISKRSSRHVLKIICRNTTNRQ